MLNVIGKYKIQLISLFLILCSTVLFAGNLPITLTAELDQEQIWTGDSVQLTLYLQGSEEAIQPNLFIPGIVIESLGGTTRSSTSITNINGKVTQNVSKAYVYAFKLTPQKSGNYVIPPISLTIEGKNLVTEQLQLTVSEPVESENFHLIIKFDQESIYTHQECLISITLLYKASLRSLDIRVPELEAVPYTPLEPSNNTDRYEIMVNGKRTVFGRDDQLYNNDSFAGLTALFSIRPDKSGVLEIAQAAAAFESVTGVQKVQDFFGRVQDQEIYSKTVIPGKDAYLQVVPFPEKGKPDNFFGLSGDIAVEVTAEPTEVHIGDPITLTLQLTGVNNTDVRIPDLSTLLGFGFDIPDTRSPDKNDGLNKTVTQTIRVTDSAVTAIPAIKLIYFDPIDKIYKQAESESIPLRVLDTQIVTSADLEGSGQDAGGVQKIISVKKQEGIYYNYVGSELLQSRKSIQDKIRSSLWIKILLLFPPIGFIGVWIFTGLVPQIRLRAIARQDRKEEIKILKKLFIRRHNEPSAKQLLKSFNQYLQKFIKEYGTEHDVENIHHEQERINASIYGNADISKKEAVNLVCRVIEKLEQKEIHHAENS
jgi:hypothetical protein